jgi:hypothetical protein
MMSRIWSILGVSRVNSEDIVLALGVYRAVNLVSRPSIIARLP